MKRCIRARPEQDDAGGVFGPVPSRRLGLSLGVDPVPFKTCTLDCRYCQLGRTRRPTITRREYVTARELVQGLSRALGRGERIDWIAISGSGEPTLNSAIGEIIRGIKAVTAIPVAVITNGTLLSRLSVRRALLAADLVIPSLDAGSERIFEKINRPHPDLALEKVVSGIGEFIAAFSGRIWLEVMLVAGLNDSEEELEKIAGAALRMGTERVQLNTPVRPPADAAAAPPGASGMRRAKRIMERILSPLEVEVIAAYRGRRGRRAPGDRAGAILGYLRRRPGTVSDLSAALGMEPAEVAGFMRGLTDSGRIGEVRRRGGHYYVFKQ